MPPRYAYWTILIDRQPTAFRAREREELLPTFNQLRRTNKDVVLKWFGRGKLWDSPEAERAASYAPVAPREKRGHDWRPGGAHKDPRARFKRGGKKRDDRGRPPASAEAWRDKPKDPARAARPWRDKPHGAAPAGSQPWRDKPRGTAPAGSQPWRDKPRGADLKRRDESSPKPPPADRPRSKKPDPSDRD